MRYSLLERYSVSNGCGIRTVLWVQGCRWHCKGCHNPQTWSFDGGFEFTDETLQKLLDSLDSKFISGLTLSGGHPLEPENLEDVFKIICEVKSKFPDKTIWLYTGNTLSYENFDTSLKQNENSIYHKILVNCDVIVDGPYIEEQRDLRLKYCGSKNQRVIDVEETLNWGEIFLLKE